MKTNIPEWATEKQKEGMLLFNDIADEYGDFLITFEQAFFGDEYEDECDVFIALIDWTSGFGANSRSRHHEIKIGWNFEKTWNHLNEISEHWQFIFGDDDECTRQVSLEVLYLSLFYFMNSDAEN